MRKKEREPHAAEPEVESSYGPTRSKCWESFFRCQPSPVLRSQMLTTLMAGTPLEVERIPTGSLLDAVLVAFTARVYCAAEVVDDYQRLLERTEELWREPSWTTRIFDSIHANAANFVINHSSKQFAGVEEQYIPNMVEWYLSHDCPEYFSEELTEIPKRMRPAAAKDGRVATAKRLSVSRSQAKAANNGKLHGVKKKRAA